MANLQQLFDACVSEHPSKSAWIRRQRGEWQDVSWRDWHRSSRCLAVSLAKLGCTKGSRVATMMPLRYEWGLVDMACARLGAVPVALPSTASPDELRHMLLELDLRLAVLDGPVQLGKLLDDGKPVAPLEHVVYVDARARVDDHVLMLDEVTGWPPHEAIRSLDELVEDGEAGLADERGCLLDERDVAVIAFSAGTCGRYRAYSFVHGALFDHAFALAKAMALDTSDLLVLDVPSRSIAARNLVYAAMAVGSAQVCPCAEPDLLLMAQELQPTTLVMSGWGADGLRRRLLSVATQELRVRPRLLDWALATAQHGAEREAKGQAVKGVLGLKLGLAQRWVLDKLRARLGGKLGRILTLGGPRREESRRFFSLLRLPLCESYGSTELGGITHLASAAELELLQPIGGVRHRLSERGEIVVAAPTAAVAQVYGPASCCSATATDAELPVVEDWVSTGDLGELSENSQPGWRRVVQTRRVGRMDAANNKARTDAQRRLSVSGRLCETIVLAGGGRVTLAQLERKLEADALIERVLVFGDGKPFLSAVVVPERRELEAWARSEGIAGNFAQLCLDARVYERFKAIVDGHNLEQPGVLAVKKFALVDAVFSRRMGELSDVRELRREVVRRRYQGLIDSFYAEQF